MAGNIGNFYDIYSTGCDKNLIRGGSQEITIPGFVQSDGSLGLLNQNPATSGSGGNYDGGIVNTVTNPVTPNSITSGELTSVLFQGKKTFTDTTAGYRMGMDSDNTYKWIMGTSGSSIDWNVTTANTLTIAGTITATSGTIGGWSITSTTLYALGSGTPSSSPSNGIVLTSGSSSSIVIYEGTTKRIELGFLSAAVFGLKGYATNGSTVIFELSDTQQKIAGWNFTDTVLRTGASDAASNVLIDSTNSLIRLGPTTGNYLTLDGANLRVRTSTFSAGLQGWSIESDGSAEFANITARGEFHSQVLSYGEIHTTAGSSLLAKAGGKLRSDVTTATSPTTFNVDIDDPDTGHTQVFAVSDILRIKDGSGNDNWMTVSSVSDQTTFYRYVCTKDNGTNATFRAGAAVVDYGPSGQGIIYSTVDGSNSPYISVQTHAGSPWSTITDRLRVGNLNGFLDYASNLYGFAIGSSAANQANITIDTTNGIRVRTATTNVFAVDNSGNATLLNLTVGGSLNVSTSGNMRSGQTAYNTGTGWFLEYNGGTPRLSIGDATTTNSLTWDGTTLSVNGSPISNNTIFGDGSDGTVTISADTTLTRDMYYNNLTIDATKTLFPGGYRIFVKGTCTINGTISRVGNAGSNGVDGNTTGDDHLGGAGGAALAAGSIYGSLAGSGGGTGRSSTGNAGSAGATSDKSISSSNGVAGGQGGTSDQGAGGPAGAAGTTSGTVFNSPRHITYATILYDFSPSLTQLKPCPGSGGGGGGSGSALPRSGGGGGGSGSSGGIISLFARILVNSGSITVAGGAGGNGGSVSSDSTNNRGGGGGGGNGGVIILAYSSKTGAGTTTITGGAGGTKGTGSTGDAANGTTGNSGTLIELVV